MSMRGLSPDLEFVDMNKQNTLIRLSSTISRLLLLILLLFINFMDPPQRVAMFPTSSERNIIVPTDANFRFDEDSYSIHLRKYISPEEFTLTLAELNRVKSEAWERLPSRWWPLLAVVAVLLGTAALVALPIVGWQFKASVGWTADWPRVAVCLAVAALAFVFGCFGVPLIISWRLKKHPGLEVTLQNAVKKMNEHYLPRGIQFKYHNRFQEFLEIEIAVDAVPLAALADAQNAGAKVTIVVTTPPAASAAAQNAVEMEPITGSKQQEKLSLLKDDAANV